ncbi:uncharacterized protein DUF397 [Stackebrandtia albiflava]|uniref:Uncharacterized protein DUF397 n=1 Tax=Stackebrandtia albiflava TaxID=406432 RepID=A0A562VEH0_9ACTN|nr:DUF397 domain-containing protein [Stackebrandtia albiflava]TWJ16283.1 uncharacterized protein DUF397 [Stackebrandtia albiflava]
MTTGTWRKSSRSQPQGANCVEGRAFAGRFQLRDSKLGDDSPVLDVSVTDFAGFLTAVKS